MIDWNWVIDWSANEWHYASQIRIRLLKQFTYRCQYIPHSIIILSWLVIIQSPFQVGRQHSITTSCRMVLLILRKFEYSSENPFPSPVTDSQARALISNEFSLLELIPYICHFFYTDRIFENQILHPKKRLKSPKTLKMSLKKSYICIFFTHSGKIYT